MVATPLKKISQHGNLAQIEVNIKKYLKPPTRNILKPDIFLILQSWLQACGLHLQELVHLRLRINRVKQQKTMDREGLQGWPWKPIKTWKATNNTRKYPFHGVLPGASSGNCFPWSEDSLPLAILCHVFPKSGLRGLWQVGRATSQIAIFIVVHALPSERARMARGWFGKYLHTWFVGLMHVWYPEWITFGYWNFIWQSRKKDKPWMSLCRSQMFAKGDSSSNQALSLSLWQCFSLNPLSYDRDAQCEVHIQICSNPSARKTYDFLVFTHRWPPLTYPPRTPLKKQWNPSTRASSRPSI